MTARRAGAVVFDFDGVLADTERLHLSAFQDVFHLRGWQLEEADYFQHYLGFDDRDLVVTFAHALGVRLDPDDLQALLDAKFRRYAERLGDGEALFPGTAPCIARLSADYPLAIASGSLRDEIRFILDASGLVSAFGTIVGADDVAAGKPAPDPYLEATRRLAVAPRLAVAVEDSRWGLESARAAGLRTVGITTSYPAVALQSADVIIDTLDELTSRLVDALVAGD